MDKEYILIESKKVAEIKYKALQKLERNKERPLSEASIEARAVIEVINYLYENNEWFDNQKSIDAAELLYNIVKKEVNELNKDR
jgi:hypothetical protein